MKKILVINTAYRIKGGEDTNIVEEVKFLKEFYEVEYLEFNNRKALNIFDLLSFFNSSNLQSNKKVSEKIKSFNPDIAYIHNTWFKANLGIFKKLYKENIPILLKIHNFRYICTKHFLINKHLKNNDPCPMCNLSKNKKVFNKYFSNSYLKSFFVILYGKKYFKILQNSKLEILVMTKFQKSVMESVNITTSKVNIFKNPIVSSSAVKYNPHSDYLVYAGRLSSEKGIYELIDAWKQAKLKNLNLIVIGDGPEYKQLQSLNLKNIIFKGEITHHETLKYIENSRGVLTATKMFEGQPRLLCEASSLGVPSLFPNYGGMSEFFPKNYGLVFEQFNYFDLVEKIKIFNDKELLIKLSKETKNFIDQELNYKVLNSNFEKILENN